MEAYYAVAPAAPDTSRATRVVRVALLRACSRRPRAGDRDAARCSACHLLNSRLAAPHVTGLWPWNLALEMAARWSASLDGNHAAPPVADARVGPARPGGAAALPVDELYAPCRARSRARCLMGNSGGAEGQEQQRQRRRHGGRSKSAPAARLETTSG